MSQRSILRLLAALAAVVFCVVALQRTFADVTVTFPARDNAGLTADVVFKCSGTTQLHTTGATYLVEGEDAYDVWSRSDHGLRVNTHPARALACEDARHSRTLDVVWLVAGGLVALIAAVAVRRRPAGGGR